MNDLTKQIFIDLWIMNGMYIVVFLPIIIYTMLFTSSKIKKGITNQTEIINTFFDFKNKNYDVSFNNKETRLINTKIFFIMSIWLFVLILLISLAYSLLDISLDVILLDSQKVEPIYFLSPLIVFGIIVLWYAVIIILSFKFATKKQAGDITNKELLKKYHSFEENWFKTNDSKIIEFQVLSNGELIKTVLDKKKIFYTKRRPFLEAFSFYHSDYNKINQFRSSLFELFNKLNKIEKNQDKKNLTFISLESDKETEINFDQLKDILLHNLIINFFGKKVIIYK